MMTVKRNHKSEAVNTAECSAMKTSHTVGECDGNMLSGCDDRLMLSDTPHCQDYFQLARLFGIHNFEKKTDPVLKLRGAEPLYAALADVSYLEEILRCGMLHTASEKEDLKTIQTAAAGLAIKSWEGLRNTRHCRKVPLAQDIELALILHYRQCWHPRGYLRGELLNSLSLAPGEELKVEFFSWDRHRIERESTSDVSRESSVTGSVTSRASLEVVNNLQFKIGVGVDSKVGANLSLASFDLPIDVNGEVGNNFESELSGAVTTTSQTLNEATLTATNAVRASHKTRVVEVSEIGAETRSTRTIRNENRCHTINYDYFEILERWQVTLDIVGVDLVARVPLPDMGTVDAAWLLCNEWPLRRHLLDPIYEAGFEAARLFEAERCFRDLVAVPPPVPPITTPAPSPSVGAGAPPDQLGDELRVLLGAIRGPKQSLAGLQFRPGDWEDLFSFNASRVSRATRRAARIATRELILSSYPSLFELIDDLHGQRNVPGRELYQRFAIFLQQVEAQGVMNITVRLVKWEAYPVLVLGFNDDGLIGALGAARIRLAELRPAVSAQASADVVLPAAGASGSGGDGAASAVAAPLSVDELVDQQFGFKALAEARVELDRLICHFTHNRDHYLSLLYLEKGPAAWDEILDASPHARDIVELRVLAIQDGYALFPLRRREQEVRGRADIRKMLKELREETRRFETCVTLPTHGTVLESRLGECEACEPFIREHRQYDLGLKAEEVEQAKERSRQERAESQRLEDRLSQDPPLLDKASTTPAAIHVKLMNADSGD
ncbi:MAG: hypothetical protein Q8K74_05805 [Candidatus Nitrotoga sp.]|nr:hypothetical protein [Candidatus Nitrotoga sp.]MDP1855551.1 hypothetical protein [Candidatus Nitrotoga sp.]